MAQPGDFAYQVKQTADIVSVIGEYVRLKKASGSSYKGLCPFHDEKTPSFYVHRDRQFYHCFGCGVSGDVFKFVMETEKLTFPEALRSLAERFGIPIPKQRGPEADAEARMRAQIYDLHEIAAACFHRLLRAPEGQHALRYLQKRAVSDEMIGEFRLGYAPGGGNGLLRQVEGKFPPEALERSGLLLERDSGGFFDRFRNRLMFPIADPSGKVIAFGGRALSDEDQPKYLNSKETPIYKKERVLFNFHRARDTMRREGRVVLVEGYMDVIGVYSAGVKNVVASCGTSLTLPHVKALSPMVKTVVVNYDPDRAGADSTERHLGTLLEENLDVCVLSLPGGLDPDEFVKENGADAYRALLDGAPSFFDFLVERARGRFDLSAASGRAEAAQLVLQYINKLPNPVERSEMAKDLADRLGLDRNVVGRDLASAAADRKAWSPAPHSSLTQAERELLRLVLDNATIRKNLLGGLEATGIWDGWASKPIFNTLKKMDLTDGEPVDIAQLIDRLEAADRTRLAETLNDPTIELIPAERGANYLEELRRIYVLQKKREQKKHELAAAGADKSPEGARAQARIFLEIREIENELLAHYRLGAEQSATHE